MERRDRGGDNCYHLRPQMQLLSTLGPAGTATERESRRKPKRTSRTKNRKINRISPSDSRPWADLPMELLDIVSKSNNLSVADYLSFGKVCRSWRLFYSETKERFMASQAPLVIYISTRAKKSCSFYEITTRTRYETKLPCFACNFCIGFSNGYLILEDLLTNIWLINPVTGHWLQYPRLFEAPNVIYCTDRAVFASIGDAKDNFLVVVLSSLHHKLMFFKENQWHNFSFKEKTWSVVDIVVFGGRIYGITTEHHIGLLSVKTSEFILLNLKDKPPLSNHVNVRLVASKEQLLIVDFIPSQSLEIYTIDLSRMEWVKVSELGNHQALFLGDRKSSRLSNTKKWGGRSNCVYHLPFLSNTCFLYSLNGEILGNMPIMKGEVSPRMNGWFFPDQSYMIENVRSE